MAIKPARLLILGIAFAAAAGAYMLSRPSQVEVSAAVVAAPAPPVVPMDKVLVAKSDLPMGMQVGPADMDWQEWLHCPFGFFVGRADAPGQAGQG